MSKKPTCLIIGPAWIGDMVMAQTLFKLLKPNTSVIDVLAPEWSRALLERMPEVNRSWVLPFKHGQVALNKRIQLGKELRAYAYQRAIVLPNSWKSALIPYAARIPIRSGWLGEMRWGLLNDIHYHSKRWPLMIQRFAALAFPQGANLPNDLPWPELTVNVQSVAKALAKYQLSKPVAPLLVLCPGAEFGPAKRWPADYYAEVAKAKLAEGWTVWLMGSAKDRDVTQIIQRATQQRCEDLAGKTSLADAIDLLSLANLVVSNDSGLMHIAAALKCPVIVVYGSTDPRFTPPLAEQVKILTLNLACSPCFKRECPFGHLKCLNELLPQQVLQAASEMEKACGY